MKAISDRGTGWINLGPALTEEQHDRLPTPSIIGSWFSSRGPIVPMATWTPPAAGSKPRPATVGIEHGAGPDALDKLREAGLSLPSGWRKLQDHAKRGIVLAVDPAVSPEEVVSWLVRACWSLCAIEVDDHWSAEVNSPEV